MTPHETGATATPGDSRATAPPPHTFGPQGPTLGDLSDAYLQDYQVRQFRSQSTARGRTAHLTAFFGRAARAAALTTYRIRQYQLARRTAGAATGTINRETSALHRMCTLAVHWGWLDTVPGFPDRLRENPPRQGFFEHPEYLAVRVHLPAPWQDILDLAYYSGWRKQEILGLTWEEIDEAGGVIRLSPERSKTLVGRMLPISHPIAEALARRAGTPRPREPAGLPPRRHSHSPLAHRVAHGLPGGRRADPLPPRLSPHCRAQPDPRERPRARRHAPDRAQEPRHLRPLQHHPRAGTARRRRPTRRVSGAAGAGGASPSAAPRGRPRRPAHRITPPPRTTRHRVRAHGPQVRSGPATAAHAATGRADAPEHGHAPGPGLIHAQDSHGRDDHCRSRFRCGVQRSCRSSQVVLPSSIPTFRAGICGTTEAVHGPYRITTSLTAVQRQRLADGVLVGDARPGAASSTRLPVDTSAAVPFPVPLCSGIGHERFQHGPLVESRRVVPGPFADGEQELGEEPC